MRILQFTKHAKVLNNGKALVTLNYNGSYTLSHIGHWRFKDELKLISGKLKVLEPF